MVNQIKHYRICNNCKCFKKFATMPRLSNVCGVCGENTTNGYEVEDENNLTNC